MVENEVETGMDNKSPNLVPSGNNIIKSNKSTCKYCKKILHSTDEVNFGYHQLCHSTINAYVANGIYHWMQLSNEQIDFLLDLELMVKAYNPDLYERKIRRFGITISDDTEFDPIGGLFDDSPLCIVEDNSIIELYIEDGTIETLPSSIQYMTSLKGIFFISTKLSKFPMNICKLLQLEHLQISNCQISTLPDALGNLTKLSTLQLSDTNISAVPATISKIVNLDFLDLSNNKLQRVPAFIKKLVKLEHLYLEGNYIEEFPLWICELPDLGSFEPELYLSEFVL